MLNMLNIYMIFFFTWCFVPVLLNTYSCKQNFDKPFLSTYMNNFFKYLSIHNIF